MSREHIREIADKLTAMAAAINVFTKVTEEEWDDIFTILDEDARGDQWRRILGEVHRQIIVLKRGDKGLEIAVPPIHDA